MPVKSFDVSAFTSKLCNDTIDKIVPKEWERFACQVAETVNSASDWTTIISYKPTLNFDFCPATEISQTVLHVVHNSKSSSCP